jgi:hypothetical protein
MKLKISNFFLQIRPHFCYNLFQRGPFDMKRELFNNFYIAEAVYDFRFKPNPSVDRLFAQFEKDLMAIFDKGAVLTRVPENAPPQVPRFVLNSRKNRSLDVSLINALCKMTFSDLDAQKNLGLYVEKSKRIFEYLKTLNFPLEGFTSILQLRFTLKNIGLAAVDEVMKDYLKMKKPANLTKALARIEYSIGNTIYHELIESYDIRSQNVTVPVDAGEINSGKAVFVQIRPKQMPVVEAGIAYHITIAEDCDTSVGTIESCFKGILDQAIKKVSESDIFLFGGGDTTTG